MNQSSFNFELPRAANNQVSSALMRVHDADFIVTEEMGFSPEGEGEHVWLYIEKQGANTQWVAEQLAKTAKRPIRDIGFSGQKDRHAITRQWFSIYLPTGDEPDWSVGFNPDEVRILHHSRHVKKIRRGIHQANHFILVLREIDLTASQLDNILTDIKHQGVPNYFGPQRFGHAMQNLHKASRWFQGEIKRAKRNEQDRWISASRSWLFNAVLAERVRQGSWNQLIENELAMLGGSHSFFHVDTLDDKLKQRCTSQDIHPSGPMHGRAQANAASGPEMESEIMMQWPELYNGLDEKGVQAARRSLRLIVEDFNWSHDEGVLKLDFKLESGGFATSVLHELFEVKDMALQRQL